MTRRADHAHRVGTMTHREQAILAADCLGFLVVLALVCLIAPLLLGGPTP